jgi:hypothetical protein
MSLWEATFRTPVILFGTVLPIQDVSWTFPPGVVNRHSVVLANICEVSQPEGQALDFPVLGDATMTIHNIVPHDDGTVLVRLEVNWPSPVDVRVQFAIF